MSEASAACRPHYCIHGLYRGIHPPTPALPAPTPLFLPATAPAPVHVPSPAPPAVLMDLPALI